MALTACSSQQEEVDRLERENIELIAERDNQRQQYADAVSRLESANKLGSATARDLATTRQQLDEAAEIARKYEAQNQKLLGDLEGSKATGAARGGLDLDRVANQMRNDSSVRNVRVDEDGNLEITLESDVTFGAGQSALTAAGKRSIQGLKSLLTNKYGAFQLRIVGHTDSDPLKKTRDKFGDNRGRGSQRALEVTRFMESDMGIDPKRMVSASRGEHEPVSDNSSETGKRKNRRVEVVVVLPPEEAASLAQAK
jgi:chemotaxis protein MotB